MARKYHLYTASCPGHAPKQCRRLEQAEKFLPDWLLKTDPAGKVVPRLDEDDKPLVATIEHTHEEIEDEDEAKKRGLSPVKDGAKSPFTRTYKISADGTLQSNRPLTAAEQAAAKKKSEAEAAAKAKVEREAAEIRDKAQMADFLAEENEKLRAEIAKLKNPA